MMLTEEEVRERQAWPDRIKNIRKFRYSTRKGWTRKEDKALLDAFLW